jgi:hypothetical protein
MSAMKTLAREWAGLRPSRDLASRTRCRQIESLFASSHGGKMAVVALTRMARS